MNNKLFVIGAAIIVFATLIFINITTHEVVADEQEFKTELFIPGVEGTVAKCDYDNCEFYFFTKDHLGSNRVMTKSNGDVVWDSDYYAFGSEVSPTTGNAYKFTGKELDTKSGLYYYGARYYDSETGRFTQADSVKGSLSNPQSLNRYSYVTNNPLKYVDPSGNQLELHLEIYFIDADLHHNIFNKLEKLGEYYSSIDRALLTAHKFEEKGLKGQFRLMTVSKGGKELDEAAIAFKTAEGEFVAGKDIGDCGWSFERWENEMKKKYGENIEFSTRDPNDLMLERTSRKHKLGFFKEKTAEQLRKIMQKGGLKTIVGRAGRNFGKLFGIVGRTGVFEAVEVASARKNPIDFLGDLGERIKRPGIEGFANRLSAILSIPAIMTAKQQLAQQKTPL